MFCSSGVLESLIMHPGNRKSNGPTGTHTFLVDNVLDIRPAEVLNIVNSVLPMQSLAPFLRSLLSTATMVSYSRGAL